MASIKKNIAYQSIYQILLVSLPLITAPYVSRVLGAEQIGIYSYTYSIANYFVLFALLGINNYGNREIAKAQDNREQLNSTFSNVFMLHIVISSLMLVIYWIYVIYISEKEYQLYAMIQSCYVIGALLDINWFFFGMEKFKTTVTRNAIVKCATTLLIFMFVRTKDDLWRYACVMGIGSVISNSMVWFLVRRYVSFIKPSWSAMKKHIKPLLVFFIPVVAISLYRGMDKIMVGILSTTMQLGFYENVDKIIRLPLGLITAFGMVMMPRLSNLAEKGKTEQSKHYLEVSMRYVLFISFAITFGLSAISIDFAPIFWGKEFENCGILMAYAAIALPFLAYSDVLRTQYIIPQNKERIFIVSVIAGAIVNVVSNLILIPHYHALGAIISSVITEIMVCAIQVIALRHALPLWKYFKSSCFFLLAGVAMLVAVRLVAGMSFEPKLRLFVEIFVGIIVYIAISCSYLWKVKDSTFSNMMTKITRGKVKSRH